MQENHAPPAPTSHPPFGPFLDGTFLFFTPCAHLPPETVYSLPVISTEPCLQSQQYRHRHHHCGALRCANGQPWCCGRAKQETPHLEGCPWAQTAQPCAKKAHSSASISPPGFPIPLPSLVPSEVGTLHPQQRLRGSGGRRGQDQSQFPRRGRG